MKRLVVLLAFLGALSLLLAPAAWAHASVVGSDPLDGARLSAAPASVSVEFDESVDLGSGGYLRVVDGDGKRVDTGSATHPDGRGARVSVTLKTGLGNGTYTASYRIVSEDAHPITGAIRFVVGDGTLGAAASSTQAVDTVTNLLVRVARWAGFAALALLGGGWLLLTVWPEGRADPRARRLVWTGWGASMVVAALSLLLQGPYSAGSGPGAITDGSLFSATLHSSYGTTLCLRLIALAALGVVLAEALDGMRRTQVSLAVLAVGVAGTFGAVGHARTQHPVWLSVGSDSLHLAAMATWIGGLVMLAAAVLPRRDPAELARVLPVFSRVALGSVGVLAITGTYQAWRGIGTLDAISATRYGRLVLLKVAIFLAILVVANLSRIAVQRRYRVVAHALSDQAPEVDVAPPRVARPVIIEIVLAAAVLAATAVLVGEPPGKAALAVAQAAPKSGTVDLGGGRIATVRLTSGRHGTLGVDVAVTGPVPERLTATAALPSRQLGPIDIALERAGAGFSVSGLVLPAAGSWVFTLTVQTSQFDSTTANTTIRLT